MKYKNEIIVRLSLDSNYSCCTSPSFATRLQPGRQKALPFVLRTEVLQYVFQTEHIHELEDTFLNNTMPYGYN